MRKTTVLKLYESWINIDGIVYAVMAEIRKRAIEDDQIEEDKPDPKVVQRKGVIEVEDTSLRIPIRILH